MKREDFIKGLEEALRGDVSAYLINENINFYNHYIIEEVDSGKTEEEVVDSLGDPWVIAKTIIQTNEGVGDYYIPEDEVGDIEYYWDNRREESGGNKNPHVKVHHFGLSTWKQRLAIITVVVAVIAVVAVVLVGVLSLLAPILIPLIILLILLRLFRKG